MWNFTCMIAQLGFTEGYCNTASPRREATWQITEGGLSREFTSHGSYGENVLYMTGQSGL